MHGALLGKIGQLAIGHHWAKFVGRAGGRQNLGRLFRASSLFIVFMYTNMHALLWLLACGACKLNSSFHAFMFAHLP
jgi:hypothetical protein